VHYYKYGWSLAEKKEYQQAIRSLDISIHYNPRSITAYLERAYVYRQLGNYSLALADGNKAIDIASNYARAYASRGQTYYHLGEYARALSDFEKAISLDHRQSETLGKWIEGGENSKSS
jgi:tetratricopeptide (TPR) repeat protein